MLISSARRALQILEDMKPARLIAFLNFAIFSCLAAISSLIIAFFLESDSAKFRLEKNEYQIIAADIFYDYDVADRQVRALEDAIFHFLQKERVIWSDNSSSCKGRISNLGNSYVIAGHQAWLHALATSDALSARIIGGPPAVSSEAVLNKYSEQIIKFSSGGYSDSPPGIDFQRTFFDWVILREVSTNSLQSVLSEIKESERKMRNRSQLAADIVVWLFVIQVIGYLIITLVDARGSGKRNV